MTKYIPMALDCLKMIYIDGLTPGTTSNLQAALVDDAGSDPRLLPFIFRPNKIGCETEKLGKTSCLGVLQLIEGSPK